MIQVYYFQTDSSNYNFFEKRLSKHSGIQVTKDLKSAEFAILPNSWEYYYHNNRLDELDTLINVVKDHNLKLISHTAGDFGVPPLYEDTYIYRSNGHKKDQLKNQHGLPAFFGDPIETYYNQELYLRPYLEYPTVGFCGQSTVDRIKIVLDVLRSSIRLYKYKKNNFNEEPQPIYPTSSMQREAALKVFEGNDGIITNYLKRKKYRAGIGKLSKQEKQKHKSTIEFFENIRNSDYVICVRGAGNFSIRFYQALAMGRIPIFVNTDCILPLEEIIDWKNIMPWVEYENLSELPDILIKFHKSLGKDGFKAKQLEMRKIWEDYLRPESFIDTIVKHNFEV